MPGVGHHGWIEAGKDRERIEIPAVELVQLGIALELRPLPRCCGFHALEQPINRWVEAVVRWDGIHRVGNTSPDSALEFDAFRYACCAQDEPVRRYTYAAPANGALLSVWSPSTTFASLSSPNAPATSVRPDTATAP